MSIGFVNDLKDNVAYQAVILPPGACRQALGRSDDHLTNGQWRGLRTAFDCASAGARHFDDARIWGIEQSFNLRITNSLTFGQNFTYLHAEDKRTSPAPNIEGAQPAPQRLCTSAL
jgi:outer membrane receptor for ferrienterochelin and colicin